MNIARLTNVIQPVALISSLWASYKVVWDGGIKRMKRSLDIEEVKLEKPRLPPGYGMFPSPMDDITDRHQDKDKEKEKSSQPTKSLSRSLPPREGWAKFFPSIPIPGPEIEAAAEEFKKTLRNNWGQVASVSYPPRGTVRVQGSVELLGPKGSCIFDVMGAYEPGASQWRHLDASMRRMQPLTQKPKGDD